MLIESWLYFLPSKLLLEISAMMEKIEAMAKKIDSIDSRMTKSTLNKEEDTDNPKKEDEKLNSNSKLCHSKILHNER